MHDIYLVIGVVLGALSIPAVLSAWSEGRSSRLPAIGVLIAAGFLVLTVYRWPGPLSLGDIPAAFVRVAARIF